MNNINELIDFIKKNHIDIDLTDSNEEYMNIKVDGKAYEAMAKAFPECLPHNEDYNTTDKNGHFDLNKTRLHVEKSNK